MPNGDGRAKRYLRRRLMILSPFLLFRAPGVNCINIIRATFTSTDPESTKKTVKLSVFFVLSGSAHIKFASKMLMKLTPGASLPGVSLWLQFNCISFINLFT